MYSTVVLSVITVLCIRFPRLTLSPSCLFDFFFFFLVRGFFLYIFDNRVSQSQHYQRCGQYSSLSWGRSCPGHGSIHGFHPPDAGTPPTPPTVTPELSPDSARWGGESQPGSNHCFGPWFTTARKPSTIS